MPAPIVLRTTCGGFRLGRDGTVTKLPSGWFAARAGGTGRRYGADLRIKRTRPGSIILLRHGKVVWRSSQGYRNDGGSVAFGPGAFAFASYRRGVFVTDLEGPERLIMRGVGLHPLAFRADGKLLVIGTGIVAVVEPERSVQRRYRYRVKNGFVFDERTESLFLVSPDRVLSRVDATGARTIRQLGRVDGRLSLAGPYLTLSDFRRRGQSDETRFTVLRRNGFVVSRWSWHSSRNAGIDYGPVASDNVRAFVFRTVRRPRGAVVVYLLRAGKSSPTVVLRHRGAQIGCGVTSSFEWRGDWLLYSATDGPTTLVHGRTGRVRSLAKLAGELPRHSPGERALAWWESAFVQPARQRRGTLRGALTDP